MGLGRGKGKFELKEVRSAHDGTGGNGTIYTSATKQLSSCETISLPLDINIANCGSKPPGSITLDFLTPTRITHDGHRTLAQEIDFQTLIRQLLRRISLLSYFHCGIDTSDWNFKGIIETAKEIKTTESNLRWYDWERYSGRQDRRIKMGGLTGHIRFEGDTEPFASLLKTGEVLHIGKNTGFGMGGYLVI